VFSVRFVPRLYNENISCFTHVEAGSITSTVTLRVVGSDEKGSLKSETVKYGHEFQGTRTRERLRRQGPPAASSTSTTHPHVREGAPQKQDCNCQTVINIWSWVDLLTDWSSVAMWLWLYPCGGGVEYTIYETQTMSFASWFYCSMHLSDRHLIEQWYVACCLHEVYQGSRYSWLMHACNLFALRMYLILLCAVFCSFSQRNERVSRMPA
jgi:hypothetical protein